MTHDAPSEPTDGEVPEQYAMNDGERPDRVRRRNRITGVLLFLLIVVIVGITVYSRSKEENSAFNAVGEPAEGLAPGKKQPTKHGTTPPSERADDRSNP